MQVDCNHGQSFAAATQSQPPCAVLGYAQYIAESCTANAATSALPAFSGCMVLPVYKSCRHTPLPGLKAEAETFCNGSEAVMGSLPVFIRKTAYLIPDDVINT